ncbi:MAG: hypothetical protein N4P89_00850 [Candidatus Lightella neohaematopini]|nr:hypothetical protein [Candidatus Lightella neohaematopini]MCV2528691.1 hypothetical protein [Candidatus Lightella neohaematopini]
MKVKLLFNTLLIIVLSILNSCSYFNKVDNLNIENLNKSYRNKYDINYHNNKKIINWYNCFLKIFKQSLKLNLIKDNELILVDSIVNNTNNCLNIENITEELIKALSNFVNKKQIVSIKRLKLTYHKLDSEIDSVPVSINKSIWLGNYLHSKYIMYTTINNDYNIFFNVKIQIFTTKTGEIIWSYNN